MLRLLKNYRVMLWLLFVIASLVLIAPNPSPRGFMVTDSGIPNIAKGEILFSIDSVPVDAESLQKEYSGTIRVETSRGAKFINANGTLDLKTEPVGATAVRFGLDIKGGVHAVIAPESSDNGTLEQIISTLQTRINVYGLRETSFRPIYYEGRGFVDVSIAGGDAQELRDLIERQGRFEARISMQLVNGTSLKLDKDYPIALQGESIVVNGETFSPGDSFTLNGITFVYDETKSGRINLTSRVFDGTDIVTVYFDPQRSGVQNGQWFFSVQLSQGGARNFAHVTQNLPASGGYLTSTIDMYLDDVPIDSLLISSSLKGRAETEISISGSSPTMAEAQSEKLRLQSILRSGALPTTITIVQLDTVSPTLGDEFLRNAEFAGMAAIIGVFLVVLVRYRNPRIVLPLVLFSLSEVVIILGIAVLIGWTIDIAAIAGIIAVVGTGVDSQIIIVDQALKGEKVLSISERMRRAFFMIFGAAGTVIAAMLPLMILGFGVLRGFAITTILGVLAAVIITRPAFGVVIRELVKD